MVGSLYVSTSPGEPELALSLRPTEGIEPGRKERFTKSTKDKMFDKINKS